MPLASSATTPRRRLTRDQRIEQLLDVAEQVFADLGYDGASIEQIASAAGITRPIIYEHFGSKDGIYLACVRRARQHLEAALFDAVAGADDLGERLRRGIDACMAFIEQDPHRWAVLFSGVAVSGPIAAEVLQMRFATVNIIADLLHAASPKLPRQEVEAYAHALSGSGEQLERWWRQNPHVSREKIVSYFHRFAWNGLSDLIA
ncbi:MAG: TetR/AcrR family transcriptional regulator [Acidimicrobiales bacterium]